MPAAKSSNAVPLSLLFILVLLAACYFFFVPNLRTAYAEWQTADVQREAKLRELTVLQQAETRLRDSERSLRSQGVDPTDLTKVIPANEDLASLYVQMEAQLAKAPSARGVTYQISRPVADAEGGKTQFTVSITSKYASLKEFIAALEKNVRPATITNLTFSLVDNGDYTLALTGYFRSQGVSAVYGSGSQASQ